MSSRGFHPGDSEETDALFAELGQIDRAPDALTDRVMGAIGYRPITEGESRRRRRGRLIRRVGSGLVLACGLIVTAAVLHDTRGDRPEAMTVQSALAGDMDAAVDRVGRLVGGFGSLVALPADRGVSAPPPVFEGPATLVDRRSAEGVPAAVEYAVAEIGEDTTGADAERHAPAVAPWARTPVNPAVHRAGFGASDLQPPLPMFGPGFPSAKPGGPQTGSLPVPPPPNGTDAEIESAEAGPLAGVRKPSWEFIA